MIRGDQPTSRSHTLSRTRRSRMADVSAANDRHDKILFWGCFVALVTISFGFITRMFLINQWSKEFGLDPAQAGRLQGIGIWPFALSIIAFSLVIDRIGYKVAMILSFLGYAVWTVMGV